MSAKGLFFSEDKEFSSAEERAYARENLVYNVTEDILVAIEELGVSKKELARRLGKSASYVTQVLSGARNMTLGSLSDICFALGVEPEVNLLGESAVEEKPKPKWETTKCDAKKSEDVSKSKNVIDICTHREWQDQAA